MRGLPEGFGELSNNGDFFVHTGAWRGEPLVLTRDQLGFEDTERVFRRITLFSVLAVFFLGLLAGWILARNIMKPVKTLSDEVRKASAARTYEPLSVELTNDQVGQLARLCARARAAAPAIIFLDEIDALCPPRDQADANANRLCSLLLSLFDELVGHVIIIAATNRYRFFPFTK